MDLRCNSAQAESAVFRLGSVGIGGYRQTDHGCGIWYPFAGAQGVSNFSYRRQSQGDSGSLTSRWVAQIVALQPQIWYRSALGAITMRRNLLLLFIASILWISLYPVSASTLDTVLRLER